MKQESNLSGVVVMDKKLRDYHLNQWVRALQKFGKLAMTERLLNQLLPNPDERQNWLNEIRMKFKCCIQEKDSKLYFRM